MHTQQGFSQACQAELKSLPGRSGENPSERLELGTATGGPVPALVPPFPVGVLGPPHTLCPEPAGLSSAAWDTGWAARAKQAPPPPAPQ